MKSTEAKVRSTRKDFNVTWGAQRQGKMHLFKAFQLSSSSPSTIGKAEHVESRSELVFTTTDDYSTGKLKVLDCIWGS